MFFLLPKTNQLKTAQCRRNGTGQHPLNDTQYQLLLIGEVSSSSSLFIDNREMQGKDVGYELLLRLATSLHQLAKDVCLPSAQDQSFKKVTLAPQTTRRVKTKDSQVDMYSVIGRTCIAVCIVDHTPTVGNGELTRSFRATSAPHWQTCWRGLKQTTRKSSSS